MIENPRYNPLTDLCEVVGGLTIDINEALRTGSVKDTGLEVEYNGIEDPDLIRGRVEDNFQAIDERNAVVGREIKRSKQAVQNEVNNNDLPD